MFPFHSGGVGVELCSPDIAQRFATLRNRPQPFAMAVLLVSSARGVIFGVFQLRVASFRVAGAILLQHFQKMRCSFCGRHSTLDTSNVILRGRRSTSDVSCCVFFANRIVSVARSGHKVQIPWQALHFVTCHENRRKPRTKGRF